MHQYICRSNIFIPLGTFWSPVVSAQVLSIPDNDQLSAQVALSMQADLLIILSDVDGIYSGHPSEPGSRLIRTYYPEHSTAVKFWGKSRVGRGGMESKVSSRPWPNEASEAIRYQLTFFGGGGGSLESISFRAKYRGSEPAYVCTFKSGASSLHGIWFFAYIHVTCMLPIFQS